MPGIVPRTKCKSVPQIALRVTLTMASVGSDNCGSGTSSSRISPSPCHTIAFIDCPLSLRYVLVVVHGDPLPGGEFVEIGEGTETSVAARIATTAERRQHL